MRLQRWIALVALMVVACALALALGTIRLPIADVIGAITGDTDSTTNFVVRALRGPRVALALLVGAALGMSGAALQGTLRNTLAEPYLLGVSGGAAVGAVMAVSAGLTAAAVPVAAFVGSAVAVALTLFVARASGMRGDPRILIMAGVIVGAFANSAIMIALANAPANTVRGALWWMMGSVGDATVGGVQLLAIYVAVGATALFAMARHIDVLALGEEAAAGLGVNVDIAMRRVFLASALLAAATVAGAGLVGFVGLVVPHLARGLGARGHRETIAASAVVGATLVVAADLVARIALPPAELPLGAVTALIGVPFFLTKLRRIV